MKTKELIKRIIYPTKYNSDVFIKWLKANGVSIGDNTFFFDPINTKVDLRRMKYLSIGDNCCITSGVQFLCHDYSWSVLRKSHHAILPDPGRKISVGNNVFIGWNTLVIGPVEIGNNVIIGANSVVTHNIEDNIVVAGNPAKKICTLDEYFEKKYHKRITDAYVRVHHIQTTENRMPSIKDMGWFGVLFLDRNSENESYLRGLPFRGDNMDEVIADFYGSEKVFESFECFLNSYNENYRK